MTSPKPIEPTEAQLTRAVLDAWRKLGLPNTLVASIPNMGARGQYGLTKGLPDLLVLGPRIRGGVGFIELKRTGGKLSKAQEEFETLCVNVGAEHRIAWGLDQALKLLTHWGVIRKIERAA